MTDFLTQLEIVVGIWGGVLDDVVQSVSTAVFLIAQAVDSMKSVIRSLMNTKRRKRKNSSRLSLRCFSWFFPSLGKSIISPKAWSPWAECFDWRPMPASLVVRFIVLCKILLWHHSPFSRLFWEMLDARVIRDHGSIPTEDDGR
jgi:hypothetical protein